jgi:hypothetical protein
LASLNPVSLKRSHPTRHKYACTTLSFFFFFPLF